MLSLSTHIIFQDTNYTGQLHSSQGKSSILTYLNMLINVTTISFSFLSPDWGYLPVYSGIFTVSSSYFPWKKSKHFLYFHYSIKFQHHSPQREDQWRAQTLLTVPSAQTNRALLQESENAAMDHQVPTWSCLFWRRRLTGAFFLNRYKTPWFSSIHSIRECNQILSAVSNRGTIKHKNIIKILSLSYLISAIHSLSSASWRRLKALVCFPVKLQIQTSLYMSTVLFLLSKTVLSGI